MYIKNKSILNFLWLLFYLGFGLSVQAQNINIEIKDSVSGKAIENANLYLLETDQSFNTDKFGKLTLPDFNMLSVTIKVSAPDYRLLLRIVNTKSNAPILINLFPVHLDLHEVTVSAGIIIQKNKNPFHIESREVSELNSISTLNIGELLGKIPGVYNSSLGNGISKPVVRGMQGMRVVTLLNGLRLEGQQWGGDHGVGFTELGVGSIEVIKGPASLLYGADALGGVVYFVDVPFAQANSRELMLQSSAYANTMGLKSQFVFKESYNKWRWMLAGSFSNHADFKLPNGKFGQNSRFNDFGGKFSISHTGERSLFQFRYNLSHTTTGIPGHTHDSLATPETFQVDIQRRVYMLPAQFFRNHLLHLIGTWYRGKHIFQTMAGATINSLIEYDEKVTKPSLNMRLTNNLAQFKWIYSPTNQIKWTTGIQAMYQFNLNGSNASDTLVPNAQIADVGVYTSAIWTKNKWSCQAGFRYDIRRLLLPDLSSLMLNNLVYQGFNGSVGAILDLGAMTFRTSLSSGFRAPHLTELFSDGYHHGALRYEKGDVNLIPERASQLDLTFEWNMEHGSLVLNPFSSFIRDYIYLQPLDTVFDGIPVFSYRQKNQVMFYGADLGYHFHPHFAHRLHWEVSVSWLAVSSMGDSSISMIPQPRLQNTLRYTFDFGKKITFKDIYIQSVLLGPQNTVAFNETKSEGYHVLDAALKFAIGIKQDLILNVGVRNIFNTSYIDHLSRLKNIQMPFPGRNIYLSLNYKLSSNLKNK